MPNVDVKTCPRGHYYDAAKDAKCPQCLAMEANSSKTQPLDFGKPASPGIGATVPIGMDLGNQTRPLHVAPDGQRDEGKTEAFIRKEIGIDPVVGWLVCVEGNDRGRDYRVHADNNFIGRAANMDICIHGDDTVSRENHAVITYDRRDKKFYFAPGMNRNIVRFRDRALLTMTEINAYDVIEIGATKLIFIPFCGEGFEWK